MIFGLGHGLRIPLLSDHGDAKDEDDDEDDEADDEDGGEDEVKVLSLIHI